MGVFVFTNFDPGRLMQVTFNDGRGDEIDTFVSSTGATVTLRRLGRIGLTEIRSLDSYRVRPRRLPMSVPSTATPSCSANHTDPE